ncbi:MAG: hypothetical protein IPP56_16665 [Bacteroidetes bacterium]|nr:hypothetical protein [Bacteroidota bacterium]
MKNTKTHYLENDYRIESLVQILNGLENSIATLKDRMATYSWYDGIFFLEDAEPIYGLAFIAMQNYIYGSIKDLAETTSDKATYLKIESNHKGYTKTKIELIIGLANYIKHRDEENLHKPTKEILESFNLKQRGEISSSPIFEGLTILNEQWNLKDIMEDISQWRTKLLFRVIA